MAFSISDDVAAGCGRAHSVTHAAAVNAKKNMIAMYSAFMLLLIIASTTIFLLLKGHEVVDFFVFCCINRVNLTILAVICDLKQNKCHFAELIGVHLASTFGKIDNRRGFIS